MTDHSSPSAADSPPTGPDPDELPDEPPDLGEIDPFAESPAEYDDLDEFVAAEWSETKTARHRVKDVIVRTTNPRSAADVAALADVSEPTARKQLNELAEDGRVRAESTANGRRYQRDPDWYRIRRIRALAQQPQTALETTLQRLDREIDGYTEQYGAADPEELLLTEGALDDDAWADVSHWRTALVDREYLRLALQYARLQRSEARLFDDSREDDERQSA